MAAATPNPSQAPRTGRGGSAAGNRPAAPVARDESDLPPPYSEFDEEVKVGYPFHSCLRTGEPVIPGALGLLNGHYELASEPVSFMPEYFGDEFSLTFTLAGHVLWGKFNLGVVVGVLRFEERPLQSSHEEVRFKWRGGFRTWRSSRVRGG